MIVDVHWHFMPEEYVHTLRRPDNPWAEAIVRDADGKEWLTAGTFRHPVVPEMYDPEAQVRVLNRRGTDVAAVSASPTLFYYYLPAERALELHRLVNDRLADLAAAYPGRFAPLAIVPLQAPELAVRELERAMLDKGLKGVEIGTNVAGRNLDDPEFLPFFRRAGELGAFVFVHPSAVLGAERLRNYYLTNLIGNPTDTAVAIASLIFGHVYDEVPGLTCCFAHGGGTFPLLLGRWDHGYRVRPECAALERQPRAYLPRIYVDSLTHDDRVRRFAIDTLGTDHVMLGSDLPFDMGDDDPAAGVTRLARLSEAERAAILGGTAARLLRIGGAASPTG